MADPQIIERAIRRVAEQRISEAAERGAFHNLPGAGKPLSDLDETYDELWWVKRWLKREQLLREAARQRLQGSGAIARKAV